MKRSFEAIKANLFPASHGAICDWDTFPWHRDCHGIIQTHKLESSQALAIDVFGTIRVSTERDRILGALARKSGVPSDGPWILELEWTEPNNLLSERRATQVDAIAFGRSAILVIECKFTEAGGGCSQPNTLGEGAHRGLRQCNGNYAIQTNPVNGIVARCALTGKGIRYWETIPRIFGLDAEQDHSPCPFRGDAYQWMRNVVLADRLASACEKSAVVIAAYADADGFATAKKIRSGTLGCATSSRVGSVIPLSYQSIIALAQSVSEKADDWNELARWVELKIKTVADE
jgi:hypothetical protein